MVDPRCLSHFSASVSSKGLRFDAFTEDPALFLHHSELSPGLVEDVVDTLHMTREFAIESADGESSLSGVN